MKKFFLSLAALAILCTASSNAQSPIALAAAGDSANVIPPKAKAKHRHESVAEKYKAACAEALEKNLPLVTFVGCARSHDYLEGQCVFAHVNTMTGYKAPCVVIAAPGNDALYFVAEVKNDPGAIAAALPKKKTIMVNCENGTCRALQTYFPQCEGPGCSGPGSCGAGGNCSACSSCQAQFNGVQGCASGSCGAAGNGVRVFRGFRVLRGAGCQSCGQ